MMSQVVTASAAVHRVLLVDDQKLIGEVLARMLARHTDVVFQYCNDASAATAAALAFQPTVILQDLVMDDIDGLEMVRRYRASPQMADVPVIMLSATAEAAIKGELLDSGANDYLVKPPNEIELLARIRVHSDAYLRLQERNAAFMALDQERAKSERLLLNILPAAIAERLKNNERTIAESFPAVTVLFTDLCGFTQFSQHVAADDLVALLDEIFSLFDNLATAHGVEKIKTIGDAYMAVAGLPVPRGDHAEAVAEMALGLQKSFQRLMDDRGLDMQVRIGIHSGPVVAGVIGKHKFIYDLWGDTVNIASRMESHGDPSMIHVSQATRNLLEGRYRFTDRGEMPIKGKGAMRTYFLHGRA